MKVTYNKKKLITYTLLFFCAINVGGIGAYICPIFLFFILHIFWNKQTNHILVSRGFLSVLIYSIVFSIGRYLYSNYSSQNILVEGILICVYYEVGYQLVNSKIKDVGQQTILILALGSALYGNINVYLQKYNILSFDYSQGYLARVCRDLWSGNILYATVNAQYFISIIALIGIGVFVIENKEKWIILIVNLITIYSILKIQSRTMLYLAIFNIVVIFFYVFFRNIRYSKKIQKNIKYVIFIIVLISISIVIWNKDIYNIRSRILSSNMYSRLVNEGNGLRNMGVRTEIHLYYLSNIFNYPFGGIPSYLNIPSAHNSILESAKYGGWIALIMYMYILMISIKNILIIMKCESICEKEKLFFSCCFLSYFVCFMMEAAQSSNAGQFLLFFLLIGMIRSKVNEIV